MAKQNNSSSGSKGTGQTSTPVRENAGATKGTARPPKITPKK